MTRPVDHHHWSRPPEISSRDRHGLGVLTESECLRLLGTSPIGRLGFSAGGLPVIYPVNFFLDGRTVVFRTEPGEKLEAARHGSVACLQVDQIDGFAHEGWSVLVTGRMSIPDKVRAARLARLPLKPWAIDGPSSLVELSIEVTSGRAVGRVTPQVVS